MSKPKYLRALLVLAGKPDVESLVVSPVGSSRYEIVSIPFWAYNLSKGDVIECGPDDDGVGLLVEAVAEKRGHGTVRVGFKCDEKLDHPEALRFIAFLKDHAFEYEIFPPRLIAVDVPSGRYEALKDRLGNVGESAVMVWEDGDPQPDMRMDRSPIRSESP